MDPNHYTTSAYGVRIPKIIYGTAWKKERTVEWVEQAINLGFRGIDTACQPKHYNEAGVGDGVAACLQRGLSRAELYLQSKFTPPNGQDPLRIPYEPDVGIAEQVGQSILASLKNLQTTYLDCLVLHSPLDSFGQTMEAWQAMSRLVDDGTVKQLGISNCYQLNTLEALCQSAELKPAILQNRFYAQTQYDQDLRAYCREQGIIYQSFWTLTANPGLLAEPLVQDLASKYQRTAAQVFFRYLTQIGIIPLTGTTSADHMAQDLAIFEFGLTPDECSGVEALL